MSNEIERKFLVNTIPADLDVIKSYAIKQGYVFSNMNFEMRLRKKEDKYFQTIKKGKGLKREEYEIELTNEQFNKLWNLTEGKRIEKKRFEINWESNLIELDIFEGDLVNLITAEIEFKNLEDANEFVPPKWFIRELTNDERFKNKNLAIQGIPAVNN
ncbi:MAG: CYTH domain-containing protein [Chlorobi bacterium]|nr:CYTH domain-containing protein [Chlorobiota bacterium]